jgi:small-conductance mechanosensitive channel
MENTINMNENKEVKDLPNALIVLILGISSIVLCWCQGVVGIVIAIAALILANNDLKLYRANPHHYTTRSYSNLKNGQTISIIGLVLAAVFFIGLLIALLFLGLNFALFPWEYID